MDNLIWTPEKEVQKKTPVYAKFSDRYSEATPPSYVASIIKEIQRIDPLLDIKYHNKLEQWHVVRWVHKEKDFTCCIRLFNDDVLGKKAEPGMWLISYLQKCDTWGYNENALKDIIESEAKHEEDKNKKIKDITHEMAKDLAGPLKNVLDGLDTIPERKKTYKQIHDENLTRNIG